MSKRFQLTLDSSDVFQLLDGLKARAEQWENTAEFLQTGLVTDISSCITECGRAEEADKVGLHYRELISAIEEQITKQTSDSSVEV